MNDTIERFIEKRQGRCIALTWSPNNKLNTPDPVFCYDNQAQFFGGWHRYMDYIICPEIGDTGHFHWHMVIHVKDKIKWYKKLLPELRYKGYVLIKTRVDSGWAVYMTKDEDQMKSILQQHVVAL